MRGCEHKPWGNRREVPCYACLIAERDRYRAALLAAEEELAKHPDYLPATCRVDLLADVREALTPTPPKGPR